MQKYTFGKDIREVLTRQMEIGDKKFYRKLPKTPVFYNICIQPYDYSSLGIAAKLTSNGWQVIDIAGLKEKNN